MSRRYRKWLKQAIEQGYRERISARFADTIEIDARHEKF